LKPTALEWLTRFQRYLATERRLSIHTQTNYALDLKAFVQFCDSEKLDDWPLLDSQHVRVFAARSHASGLQARSIQRRLSAVRTFFDFLLREHIAIRQNPGKEVRAPKSARVLPQVLDADQMAQLLQKPEDTDKILEQRDHAIMELFYSSGLRLAELLKLDLVDLDLKDHTVRVLGKGDKTRIVPVGRMARTALQQWLSLRSALLAQHSGQSALFVSRSGRRLSARAVQKRVAIAARRRGLTQAVHPHLFRHSFASHLLESSGELRGVQELLGHANISTTQIYSHLDFQHLARIYDAAHPRAKKKS
jgi:integrase/recombinase XerC